MLFISCAIEIECKGTINILISQAIYLKIVHFLNESILIIKIYTTQTKIITSQTKRIYKNNTRAYLLRYARMYARRDS